MTNIITQLCGDLAVERAVLIADLLTLSDEQWQQATPSPGWTILDQVTHLAWFDDAAAQAMVDPEAFQIARDNALGSGDNFVDQIVAEHRHMTPGQALEWLQAAGASLVDAAGQVDPKTRVPWYGSDMSPSSALTARIMETWAHGVDIRDTLDLTPRVSAALWHVAFLGWKAIPNSFLSHGRDVPTAEITVLLDGGELGRRTFGESQSLAVVTGSLMDYCLLVTQRRNLVDTDLQALGRDAAEYLSIAQAFAGPPGAGRPPRQSQ